MEHEGAVDLLDHPPFRLRDEAPAVVGVAPDHFDSDVLHRSVDDRRVLEALVDQGFLQVHPASFGRLVQQGDAGLVVVCARGQDHHADDQAMTSTASPRLRPGVFLFTSSSVVTFGTPAATRTDCVSMITSDGSSNRLDRSRTWQRRISWIRWSRPSSRHRVK